MGKSKERRSPEAAPSGEVRRDGKSVVGRSEYVAFPEWGIAGLHAKIDTGARTSALHVEDLEVLPDGRVRFHVML